MWGRRTAYKRLTLVQIGSNGAPALLLAVRLPHMAPAAVIGETGNGLNPL
jgi:hypothetical protein